MRLVSLTAQDFRCFEDFTIRFSETHQVHVILAENMAGKSALIRALRIAAHTYVSGLVSHPSLGIELQDHRVIGDNPVANIARSVSIETEAVLTGADGGEQRAQWKKYKENPVKERTKTRYHNGSARPGTIAKAVYDEVLQGRQVLPLFNFIGTEYIHTPASETDAFTVEGNAVQGYWDWFSDKSTQKFLFNWLSRIDGILAESARKPTVAEAYGSLPADAMRVFQQAVTAVLPDIRTIEWLEDQQEPVVKLANGDVRLFSMLSDGYRYLILLAGELATRAILLNKHLGQLVLGQVPGIVLIDEFGIHLHPSLQNDALRRLSAAFPRVQFIISTHSPLLVNGLAREQIHLLEMDAAGKRSVRNPEEDAIGLGAEGILRHMFGLASTLDRQTLAWREEYATLFRKKASAPLGKPELERFEFLRRQLEPLWLEPRMTPQEDDAITSLVREKLQARSTARSLPQSGVAALSQEAVSRQVDQILDDLFAPQS
ncbi:MAG: AAA family ATPase [Bacteroidia bacterium]|nr:AAA family ATPase [Bacteroidia bacterium]